MNITNISRDLETYEKIRRRLIGFATFILITALLYPWFMTDKWASKESRRSGSHTINLNDNSRDMITSNETLNARDKLALPSSVATDAQVDLETKNKKTTLELTQELAAKSNTKSNPRSDNALANVKTNNKTNIAAEKLTTKSNNVKTEPKLNEQAKVKTVTSKAAELAAPKTTGKKYMIQLVALKNKKKIDELAALLILNNYSILLDPKNPKPDDVVRIKLGYYSQREQAEKVVVELKKLTQLEGKILTY